MSSPTTPDEVFAAHAAQPVNLELRLLEDSEDGEPFVLISGDQRALRFLAGLLNGLAERSNLPAKVQLGPRCAGHIQIAPGSDVDLYLQCTEEASKP